MSAKPENNKGAIPDKTVVCDTEKMLRRRMDPVIGILAAAVILCALWLFIRQRSNLIEKRSNPENQTGMTILPSTDAKVFSAEFQVMGTIAKVSVYSEKELDLAARLCLQEFAKVEQMASLYHAASELSRLNASAGKAPFVCSAEMWQLLMRSKLAYEETDGNFDITVKPLMELWGFYRKRETSPPDEEISRVLKLVGFNKLKFDEEKRTVFFTVPGMALDLGGIAKGYAVDRAAEKLKEAGIGAGVIDLGGNLRMLDAPPPGKQFYRVAIRDPHKLDQVLPETLGVAPGKAVASSGDYERFVIYNGKRYGHIISPVNGRPGIVSAVTVVTETAFDADVFSTGCALGGENIAKKIKEKYPDTEIYFTR